MNGTVSEGLVETREYKRDEEFVLLISTISTKEEVVCYAKSS